QLVEAGAHDGRLAKDILRWLQGCRPGLFEVLEYTIIEPSARRREWQERTLGEFSGKVRWGNEVSKLAELKGVRGGIFSNELLDAMPVGRFAWDAKSRSWFEWGVASEKGRFVWKRMPKIEGRWPNLRDALPAENGLLEVLPDGFTLEWN